MIKDDREQECNLQVCPKPFVSLSTSDLSKSEKDVFNR
jgi:hypothetical protein